MGVRGSRTRAKLLAGLAVLGAVWAFAAFSTGGDAARLFRARAIGESLGQPADMVILELQAERRLSTIWLAGPADAAGRQAALAVQRRRTDQAYAALRDSADGGWARLTAGDDALGRADTLLDRLAKLPELRTGVDGHRLDRDAAATGYTDLIDVAFGIYGAERAWSDPGLARRQEALVASARARELLAREDTLVRGALTAGGLTDAERGRLGQLASVRRYLHAEAQAGLVTADRDRYRRLIADPGFTTLRAVEDRLVRTPAADLRAGQVNWTGPADAVLAGLRELTVAGAREAVSDATPAGVGTIVGAGFVGGLGLIGVIAAFIVGLRGARTAGSATLAGLVRGRTEAAGGPDPTRGALAGHLGPLLLDLNRRNQALLHRQLRVLDAMERRESDDEDLGDLFRADHLATRVRRNVEKLLALAGEEPGRRWRRPVPMVDVVRAAAAEVGDYPRVAASDVEPAGLIGTAVTDVSHLLAELVENATVFSPAQTRVRVDGERRGDGYAITVVDSGPGMPDDDLTTAHEVLADDLPPAGGAWWGLYSVGRLAARHGIAVALDTAPGGGLIAEVRIPAALLTWPGGNGDDAIGVVGDTETEGHAEVDGDAAAEAGGGPGGQPGGPPDEDDAEDEPVRTTPSGLPTRVHNVTIPAPTRPVRAPRENATTTDLSSDRVARLRRRVEAAADTMELPVTPGIPDPTASDQQSTVRQPGRKS